MAVLTFAARKQPRRPQGCEGHLTRRQAAAVLGFASEFKIRQFERQGLLRSVRGAMRTAFYPRAEVLALKARLAERETLHDEHVWSDADLIALLSRPNLAGRQRTALDLVTDARISIERAERVYAFWAAQRPAPSAEPEQLAASAPSTASAEPDERRGPDRLGRDRLIQALRDPDPRRRQQAFDRLRAERPASG
jgi:hypothetical protein